MLPLCTSVTESRPFASAYWIALRTSRSVPSRETGLIADRRCLGEADLAHAHLVLEEVDHLAGAVGSGLPLDPGVDVLAVLAEDHHVRLGRVAERAGHTWEVADGAEADVEVELLAERDVERADPAAHRRRQRALDRDREVARRLERLVGEPDVAAVEARRLLARVHLHPLDLARAVVGLRDRRVDHGLHHGRDVDADPVALDERDDRLVGRRLAGADSLAFGRDCDVRLGAHWPTVCSLVVCSCAEADARLARAGYREHLPADVLWRGVLQR